jgi:hypothetical protein
MGFIIVRPDPHLCLKKVKNKNCKTIAERDTLFR